MHQVASYEVIGSSIFLGKQITESFLGAMGNSVCGMDIEPLGNECSILTCSCHYPTSSCLSCISMQQKDSNQISPDKLSQNYSNRFVFIVKEPARTIKVGPEEIH